MRYILQPQDLFVWIVLCGVLQQLLSLMRSNVQIPGPQLRDQDACDVPLPLTALTAPRTVFFCVCLFVCVWIVLFSVLQQLLSLMC